MTLREEIEKIMKNAGVKDGIIVDSKTGKYLPEVLETLVNDQITSFAERVEKKLSTIQGAGNIGPLFDAGVGSAKETAISLLNQELEAFRGKDE